MISDNALKLHQANAYEALVILDELFRKNKIEYFLLAGSVLGAVRHGGFIPWDDDIDIGIFVKDKERVSEILSDGLPSKYKWVDRNIDSVFPRFFGKILCNSYSCIDVFILVKTSNSIRERKKQWKARKLLFKLYKAKIHYINQAEFNTFVGKLKVFIAYIISKFISLEKILELVDKNERKFEKLQNNKYYLNLYSIYTLEQELIRSEWIHKKTMIKFETGYFSTIGNTNAYLTHLYGDYMTLPPKNKRYPGHNETFEEG